MTIVAHSLGGNICLRYSGIFPDKVRKLVAIEGLGPSPKVIAERKKSHGRAHARLGRRAAQALGPPAAPLPDIEDAFKRMQEENKHLSAEQARHLTEQGVNQNEDGTYSWKFDNYVRAWPPYDMSYRAIEALWAAIACPTLLIYGKESWASNPEKDGRIEHFKNAKVVEFDRPATGCTTTGSTISSTTTEFIK